MSLILEALKKSEARRQLGETPGLGTPFTVTRRRRSALPLLAVLVVVAVAFGAWYLRTPAPATGANTVVARAPVTPAPNPHVATRATPAPAATATPVAAGSPVGPAPARAADGGVAPATGAGATPPVQPPMTITASTGAMHPAAHPVDDAIARRERALAVRGERRDSVGAKGATAAGANTPAAPARQASVVPPSARPNTSGGFQSAAVPAAAAAAAARPAPQAAAPAAVSPPAPPPPRTLPATPPPPAPVPAATPAPAPAATNLPLYYELPYDLRKDLPPLVVSMHVYAAAPAQRFIVVDGERKTEGESLKDGLTVREIRTDGVVLEFRGQRFFYPRPGR